MTEILPKYQLAITAYWSKRFFLVSLIISSFSLSAQDKLEGERLRLFNEQYFAAQNAKNRGDSEEALVIFEALYQKDPQNGAICYELAQLYASKEEVDKAIFHAERASSLEPDNEWYFKLKLAIYRQFERFESLQSSLLAKIEESEEKAPWRFQLAEAYYKAGLAEKSLEQLDLLENEIGINEQVINQKKSLYLEMGRLDDAAAELQKLINAFPKRLDYRGTLGQLYQANNRPQEALAQFNAMVALDSSDPRPHLDLANYYRIEGDFNLSLHHLKKAMASKQLDMERKIAVLLSLFEASQSDSTLRQEAFSILDDIVSLEPEDPRIYAMYGDYLSREGRDKEAVSYYKRALEFGQKFPIWEQILLIEMQNRMFPELRVDAVEALSSFPNQPLPYLLAGIAFNENDESETAVEYLEQGQDFVFDNPQLKFEFFVQLAAAFHKMENHAESDTYFDKALAINANSAVALNNYAYYLSLRGVELNKALEMSNKANEISPKNAVYLDTKAWVLHQLNRNEEARNVMEEALTLLKVEEAEILEHYGDILKALEENQLAKENYEKARAIKPSPELEQKLKALN